MKALTEHRLLRFAAFTGFYLVQGFPIGLMNVALPAYLIGVGLDKVKVAEFVAITGLPWAFKLLAAPLMDRYQFAPMGRRRPWILSAQSALLLSIGTLLFINDISAEFGLFIACCFLINCFAAIQDVAVDGMAIDVLPTAEQGRANSLMSGGQVFGIALSAALTGTALSSHGIIGAAWVLLGLVGPIVLVSALVRERPGERLMPWTPGVATPRPELPARPHFILLLKELGRLLILPVSLVLILIEWLYRSVTGLLLLVNPTTAVESLGYTAEQFAQWAGTSSAIAALLGVLLSPVVDRLGPARSLGVGLCFVAITLATFALLQDHWREIGAPMLLVQDVCTQFTTISMIALFMSFCSVKIAATQFAVYMALANLARSFGASLFPSLDAATTSAQGYWVLSAVLLLTATIAMMVVRQVSPNHVNRTELAANVD